ncbi:MAG: single-stranded DNA-binding protein [Candidatus Marinimicrobia bacterium]|nr:single-stranded DNA-binding protein [Candidatus Neomarinimicrobiota bacterium]
MEQSSVNKVILVGRLGKDPDVRYTSSGDAVAEISVATSERFKNQQGEFTDRTEWHKCIVWRNTAEFVKKYMTKGQLVYVEGKLQTRKWQDKEGNNRYATEIQVNTLTPLGTWAKGEGSGNSNFHPSPDSETMTQVAEDGEDDIPF